MVLTCADEISREGKSEEELPMCMLDREDLLSRNVNKGVDVADASNYIVHQHGFALKASDITYVCWL